MSGTTKRTSSHRAAALTLVAIGTVVGVLAIFAVWINRQALDTDNWTQTSSRLLEDRAIRTAVSGFLVDQLYANVDVAGEIGAALPPRAQPLAGPAAGALRDLAEKVTVELLQRPRVQSLWENANRSAHQIFLKIVTGGGPLVSTEGGVVRLDLRAILAQLAERTGVGGGLVDRIPADAAQVTVLRSDQLSLAQTVGKALRPLALALVLLMLACFGGAIALARTRRREVLRAAGFGLIVAGAVALVGRALAGGAIVDALATTEAARPAAESVWRIGTGLLVEAATATLIYGIVVVLGTWLAGPTRAAVAVRRGLAPYLSRPAYAYGGAAVILLLVFLWGPTPGTRHVVPGLILTALFVLGVLALRRQVVREHPGAADEDLSARHRATLDRLRTGVSRRRTATVHPRPAPGNGGVPPAVPDPAPDPLAQLERLADLRDRGALTEQEFDRRKQELLAIG